MPDRVKHSTNGCGFQSSTLRCKDNRFQACTAYLWQPTWHAACYFRFLPVTIRIAQQVAILSAVASDMGKHYSAYCSAWSAIRPLYGLSEIAGCTNRKSVMEVILLRESGVLPHVATVASSIM